MNTRARMIDLAGELLRPEERSVAAQVTPSVSKPKTSKPVFRKPENRQTAKPEDAIKVNRPYGERGEFEKVTVTLPRDVRALLLDESIRRKKKRSEDWPIAAIVREALASYLNGKGG